MYIKIISEVKKAKTLRSRLSFEIDATYYIITFYYLSIIFLCGTLIIFLCPLQ